MAIKGKGSKAPASKLTKMQFSKAKYPTVKSVKDYLSANNIEGADKVTDGDDVWIVKSSEDFSGITLGKARSTATKHEGVTAFIAPVTKSDPEDDEEETVAKGDDGDDEETADAEDGDADPNDDEDGEEDDTKDKAKKASSKVKTVAGSETKVVRAAPKPKKAALALSDEDEEIEPVLELAEKYDFWGAYTSGSDSLMGVLKDGMTYDNVPPGMEDVMMAAFTTIGNVLSNDTDSATKLNSLKQMGDELATITVGLFDLFSQATEDATKSLKPGVRKSAKKFSESFAESVSRMVEGDLSVIANVDNETDEDEDADKGYKKPKTTKLAAALPTELTDTLAGIAKTLAGIGKRQDRVEREMSRAPVMRSMSDSMSEIIDADDLEDEDADEQYAAARIEEVRRGFGLRPTEPGATAH